MFIPSCCIIPLFYNSGYIVCMCIQKYHVSVFTYNNNNTENSVLAWIGILNARSEYFAVVYLIFFYFLLCVPLLLST